MCIRALFWALLLMFISARISSSEPKTVQRWITEGRFGNGPDLSKGRLITINIKDFHKSRPLMFDFWAEINNAHSYNIFLSVAPKWGAHWEIFTTPGTAAIAMYMLRNSVPDQSGSITINDGEWHFIAFRIWEKRVEMYCDGENVFDHVSASKLEFDDSLLFVGGIAGGIFSCDGSIDELRISRDTRDLQGYVPESAVKPDGKTSKLYHFDRWINNRTPDAVSKLPENEARMMDEFTVPSGDRFLDEVMDEAYFSSTLHGDAAVEAESLLPLKKVPAIPSKIPIKPAKEQRILLSGEWLMKDCEPRKPARNNNPAENSPGLKANWHRPEYDRSHWYKVTLPSSVQSALLKLGIISDPHWNTNTYDELQKYGKPEDAFWANRFTRIEQREWWFAREFSVPKSWKGKKIRLYFDGIDYSGSFYLNGKPLGCHFGMFGGPTFDVTNYIDFDNPNTLVARIDRAPGHWSGILKGSPGWGWHYGHLVSIGIWRDIDIQTVPDTEIQSPYVVTKSIKARKTVLDIEYHIASSSVKPMAMSVCGVISLKGSKTPVLSFENKVTVSFGKNRYRTSVSIPNPKLWWPMNYGDQNLYDLNLTVAKTVNKKLAAVDSVKTRFGIRTLEMRPAAGAKEETDYRWQFVINGIPMFIKGANWCWSDPMLEYDSGKYERILELARRGGIQMFRAWGGGIIETDDFYRICDEKGLMVYQEFPFCWGPPDFPSTDPAVVDQQTTQVIKRLRNHPSLVMWEGGNENVSAEGGDEGLFLVGRRCRQYDPSRPFHRISPWGGSIHNWGVFHSGLPIDSGYHGTKSVFSVNMGFPV